MEAYCVKCRAKREMAGAKAITMKNGKPATGRSPPRHGRKHHPASAFGSYGFSPRSIRRSLRKVERDIAKARPKVIYLSGAILRTEQRHPCRRRTDAA